MSVVFVGGYLRSGTTLLQSVLCSGADSNPMIGEAVYLRGTLENYNRSLRMFDLHARYYFSSAEDLRQTCAKTVEQFIERTAARYDNPKHVILRHPQLTPLFPLLHELVPAAKLLIVVRDPRDTVASAVRAHRRGASEFGDAQPQRIARSMLRYYAACLSTTSESFCNVIMYVKYEMLVQQTSQNLKEIQEFTGVDVAAFDPEKDGGLASDYVDRLAKRGSPMHSDLYGKNVSASRVGNFREVLQQLEILQIENICQPLFDRFNYTPVAEME